MKTKEDFVCPRRVTASPTPSGGYTHYDGSGKKIGRSEPGFFGEYKHYDARGRSTGHSDPGFLGGYNHYDSRNHRTGSSDPGFLGGYNHSEDTGGCYVATCVYGSYDCPQVWTLRRFRDNILAEHVIGRMFIRTYYAISPMIVRLFGQTAWFRTFWRKHLDHLVHRLQREGVEDTPYRDKIW